MATLATQAINPTGLTPTYAAATGGGDKITPGPTTFLHVKNASGAGITVTVNSQVLCNQGADHDLAVVVPATVGDKMIGPLTADRYAAPADGLVAVTYSGVTSLTVAAISM